MSNTKENIFDITLFKRLFEYTKPYKTVFYSVLLSVLLIAGLSIATPKLLQIAIDDNIKAFQEDGFLFLIILMIVLLLLQTIFQFFFQFYAAWLGQNIVKDVRVLLFNHMLKFKMKYYDNSSVGMLITRAVTDMERIADIFGQGLFMIIRDLMVMLVISVFMMYTNFKLSLIVFVTMPIVLYATKIFQRYMKKAFEEVRNEVSNLNSFVQERVTGMKILQLFTRETTEYKNF